MASERQWIRIVGIDPGSRTTGFGVIESSGARHRCIAYGRIRTEDSGLPQRLLSIQQQLTQALRELQPHEAAIEGVFVKRNNASALVLGHARGVALCTLAAADLPVAEYTPATVKKAICGNGRAEKPQMQYMVRLLLKLTENPPADAADALAVALCHAQQRALSVALKRNAA